MRLAVVVRCVTNIWQDEALLRADELAQNEIKDIIKRAKARRWQIVAKNLQKLLKKEIKYGPKACEKRFVDIMDDNASIPMSLDDDPAARQAERARRQLEKLKENAEKELRESAIKEQKLIKAQEQSLVTAMKKKLRAEERALKAKADAEAAQRKLQSQGAKQQAIEQKRRENAQRLQRATAEYAKFGGVGTIAPESFSPAPISPSAEVTSSTTSTLKRKRNSLDVEGASSPRNHLSVKELGHQLRLRGLIKSGSKAAQIRRLEEDDHSLAVQDLRAKLRGRGLNDQGDKDQLVARLVASEVAESAWGQKHGGVVSAWDNGGTEIEPAEASGGKRVRQSVFPAEAMGNKLVEDDHIRAGTVDSGVGGSATAE